MNKKMYLLGFAWVFLLASPAWAGIEWINGAVCPNDCRKTTMPFLQGKTTEYVLKGDWLDYVNKVEDLGSGVSVSKRQGLQWPARLVLGLQVDADAEPGKRTLKLVEITKDLFGNPNGRKVHDTLDIYIVRAGTFSSAGDTTLPDYFNEAKVTLNGSKIGNAAVVASGWPQGTAAFVSESTDTKATVTLKFPKYLAEAEGDIVLYDKDLPSAAKNLMATYFYKDTNSNTIRARVTIVGPNKIDSITFPTAGNCGTKCYEWGSTVTVRLNFLRPVRQQGETIYWQLSPAKREDGNRTAEAVAPTTYDPSAQFNTRTVGARTTSTDLVVKICCCAKKGEGVMTVNTWIGSTNSTSEPGFKQASFTVTCPTGFNAHPRC